MRKNLLCVICALLALSFSVNSGFASVRNDSTNVKKANDKNHPPAVSPKLLFFHYVDDIYQTAGLFQAGLDSAVFQKAIVGYYNLKIANLLPANSSVVTIVDFNLPGTVKRMWIVDMQSKKLILNTWCAHGQGSGLNTADTFSNIDDSHQSSLGFYITDDIYVGKHGRSLHLDGVDTGYNDLARKREIVLHGADYVNQSTIDQQGYLGRSFGCPAVSTEVVEQVISTIKDKTMIFINGNDDTYTSKYLDQEQAAKLAFADSSFSLVKDVMTN